MKKKISIALCFSFLFAGLAACAGPSRLEMDYGTSFKLHKFNQIADPEAGKTIEQVSGMDGKAAQASVEKYHKDFEKPAPAPVYTLSIGSLGK